MHLRNNNSQWSLIMFMSFEFSFNLLDLGSNGIKILVFLCLASVRSTFSFDFTLISSILSICIWLGKSFMQSLLRGRDKCSPHSVSTSYPLQVSFLLPPFFKTSPVLSSLISNIIICPYFWCSNCSERCKKCPICRIIIEERLPVYDV